MRYHIFVLIRRR